MFGTSKDWSYLWHPTEANDQTMNPKLTKELAQYVFSANSKVYLKVLHRILTNKKQTSSDFSMSQE